ncbi:MAG: lactate utilization protein [Bacillota bacterium]|nr:lactate utilization protein [Bacillota bacterium]
MMDVYQWHNEITGKRVVEALKKNHFDAIYCPDGETAVTEVMKFITPGAKVGFGGSVTTRDLKLPEKVLKAGAIVLDHQSAELDADQKAQVRLQQLTCDVFISGTNALTIDGELVNVDGTGNRVAAMIYGPKKVVIVVGINKVVADLDAAFDRIEQVASPMNNKRLARPNPCVKSGTCMDCEGGTRICNVYSILRKKPSSTDTTVIVVGEALGY